MGNDLESVIFKDDLSDLTDVELRTNLQQYGFPNLPVTETTRNILLKKLKNHIDDTKRSRMKKLQNDGIGLNCSYIDSQFIRRTPASRDPQLYVPDKFCQPSLKYMAASKNNYIPTTSTFFPDRLNSPKRTKHEKVLPADTYGTSLLKPDYGENTKYLTIKRPPGNTSFENSLGSSFKSNVARPYNPHFGVVKRLLNLRNKTLRKETYQYENRKPNEKPEVVKTNIPKVGKILKNLTLRNLNSKLTSWSQLYVGLKQLIIPYALICVFVIFFASLSIVYILKSSDLPNTIIEKSIYSNTSICSEDHQFLPSSNCIERHIYLDAIFYYKNLEKYLHNQAKFHFCVDKKVKIFVSSSEFTQHLYNEGIVKDEHRLNRSLHIAAQLIKSNSQWNIRILNLYDPKENSDASPSKGIFYFMLKPNLPLRCVFYNKIHKFFLIVGTGAILGLVVLLSYIVLEYLKNKQTARLMAVKYFTEEIKNELLYQMSLNSQPECHEVIANHLRDRLVPINKRDSLLWAWNEAMKLLETSDSRIQFGVKVIDGEEFQTMKWIGNICMTKNRKKQWHSPAFSSANKVINPPTPCLKIRHMFDSSDVNNPEIDNIIKEAIFQKVGSQCKVCDIQLDKQSCCVYVRCASESDAGIIHNEINGWWFDKQLVSIKFLRLQRYLDRYPTEITYIPCKTL